MLDIKWIRANPDAFDRALKTRGVEPAAARLIELDDARRAHVARLQEAQERRNSASKEIGKAKASGDEEKAKALIDEIAELKAFVQGGEEEERRLDGALRAALEVIPNLPLEEVPVGADESDNVVHHFHGEKPSFDFEPKEHFDIEGLKAGFDFDRAGKIAGARFAILRGELAALERALGQFMVNLQTTENGYEEVSPPLLVRDEPLYGTAQLPKFAEDLFHTTDGRWLIPTAEVPLTNLVREEILDEADLPMRVTGLTYCFRSEAGAAGRDVRGILRQHQFQKCELVSITRPEDSLDELERMLGCAEEVLKRLGLHYRVVTLCTGDMGFGARKTYDIEVWLPGQQTYREISSCSVCGDFQARRMNARYRPAGEKGVQFVHTLNGSGLAVGRALIAVVENYQNADGSVTIPPVLRPLMGGREVIGKL
ncbi:serine--tRNA ligase [Breoghania sp.]|uniref:serine--tRNA ligase n=1 Tax=Breoghania sp. TaxID=2065378 RepID=UPI002AABCB2B|nr:serine--tRNA ligase [Breoghania sp.]